MSQSTKPLLAITFSAFLGMLVAALNGCSNSSSSVDAKTLAVHRTRLAMAEEPDEAMTVAEVRATLLGEEDAHEDHDHDGDGIQDHAPEDHVDEEHANDENEAHEEEHDEHADHDHDDEAHDEEDHDPEGHEDHESHDHDAHAASEPMEVSIVGHIGGLANPWAKSYPDFPFAKNEALIFLADPQAIIENEASGHVHAPGEECAFCAAHAADKADMLAMVQFVDEKGKVLPIDARELFDVNERDLVVIQGMAHVSEGGILVVDAKGLYVRK